MIWHCRRCHALSARSVCRSCGAPPCEDLSLEARPVAPLLRPTLPPLRAPRGAWFGPVVLVALALLLASPALPGSRQSRAEELREACASLHELRVELERSFVVADPLSADWPDRLAGLPRRYRLDGDAGSPTLASAEVTLHAAVLELASLQRRGEAGDALERLHATGEDLSRIAEDLTHVR